MFINYKFWWNKSVKKTHLFFRTHYLTPDYNSIHFENLTLTDNTKQEPLFEFHQQPNVFSS
jgi:hypothetical protein